MNEVTDNTLMSGSYDKTLKHWDLRKLNMDLEEFDTGLQIWDVHFNDRDPEYSKYDFVISGVYDGYQFCKLERKNDFRLEGLEIDVFTGHESICYGAQFHTKKTAITTSFYDSTIKLIKFA